ncbi:hypothetical protein ACRALDRAFT_205283 [Sodiomyces alcalophilus JCM 7366]|uniref:uncharacterized protein n=1 Tax=Sodiomyces alcalophilus JCM 7366 TaxID=591952 RepID=UPI0039B46124
MRYVLSAHPPDQLDHDDSLLIAHCTRAVFWSPHYANRDYPTSLTIGLVVPFAHNYGVLTFVFPAIRALWDWQMGNGELLSMVAPTASSHRLQRSAAAAALDTQGGLEPRCEAKRPSTAYIRTTRDTPGEVPLGRRGDLLLTGILAECIHTAFEGNVDDACPHHTFQVCILPISSNAFILICTPAVRSPVPNGTSVPESHSGAGGFLQAWASTGVGGRGLTPSSTLQMCIIPSFPQHVGILQLLEMAPTRLLVYQDQSQAKRIHCAWNGTAGDVSLNIRSYHSYAYSEHHLNRLPKRQVSRSAFLGTPFYRHHCDFITLNAVLVDTPRASQMRCGTYKSCRSSVHRLGCPRLIPGNPLDGEEPVNPCPCHHARFTDPWRLHFVHPFRPSRTHPPDEEWIVWISRLLCTNLHMGHGNFLVVTVADEGRRHLPVSAGTLSLSPEYLCPTTYLVMTVGFVRPWPIPHEIFTIKTHLQRMYAPPRAEDTLSAPHLPTSPHNRATPPSPIQVPLCAKPTQPVGPPASAPTRERVRKSMSMLRELSPQTFPFHVSQPPRSHALLTSVPLCHSSPGFGDIRSLLETVFSTQRSYTGSQRVVRTYCGDTHQHLSVLTSANVLPPSTHLRNRTSRNILRLASFVVARPRKPSADAPSDLLTTDD